MVRAMEHEQEGFRSRFFHFRGTHENAGRHAKSLSVESANILDSVVDDDLGSSRSQGSTPVHKTSTDKQQAGLPLAPLNRPEKAPKLKLSRDDNASIEKAPKANSSRDDNAGTEKEARDKMALGSSAIILIHARLSTHSSTAI